MIGNLIGGFIVILIGFGFLPTIKEEVSKAITSGDVTGASQTIFQLIPFIFITVILITAVTTAIQGLRNSGIIGGKYQDEYEEALEQNPEHKQTYYEYVQERIKAQRAISKW